MRNFADRIIVVSPKYASEIMTDEFGEGMDFTLRCVSYKIRGILNGIDYKVFNPKTDKALIQNYDINSIEKKEKNKEEILNMFGFENKDKERPLIAVISRLVNQKGLNLIRDMEYELQKLNANFVILGSGDKDLENLFIWLSNNTQNIRAQIGYNEQLAHKIYGASDMFLMPSKFEPCGLGQLIAMRYGSLPIVRAVGGLDNTVVGYPLNNSTGFKFWRFNGYDMLDAIRCALSVYNDKFTLNAMRKSAMEADFTWAKSAKEYLKVYHELKS